MESVHLCVAMPMLLPKYSEGHVAVVYRSDSSSR